MNPIRSHTLLLALALASTALSAAERPALLPDAPSSGVVSDPEFLRRASAASTAEAQMSQLAVGQALDTEVRAEAGSLGTDHVRNRDQLAALAKSKSIDLPQQTEGTYQLAIDDLRNLKGSDFDAAYLKTVRTDHEMLVDLFQGAAAHANDPDVRAYAASTLPVLQAQLAKTQQLEIKRR